jgi:hypothetical protein
VLPENAHGVGRCTACTGMGYPLAGANSVMMYVHYLNLGSATITVSAQITLTPAKPGVVTQYYPANANSPDIIGIVN